MYVAVSGHRPEKIVDWNYVSKRMLDAFDITGVSFLYEGQCAGVDIETAELAYKHGIGYVACMPYPEFTGAHKDWKYRAQRAIHYASDLVNVSESYCGKWVFQKRNEYMVDNADYVIAVWDGSVGGTANTVKYAEKKGKRIWRINPATREAGWTTR